MVHCVYLIVLDNCRNSFAYPVGVYCVCVWCWYNVVKCLSR